MLVYEDLALFLDLFDLIKNLRWTIYILKTVNVNITKGGVDDKYENNTNLSRLLVRILGEYLGI